jgi:Ser/Thr protein kinase RdoA (MazF antagonist)
MPAMLAAAARELRRAHEQECTAFHDGLWSHGDPHAGNFVYEESTDRARLIDFEVMHHRTMSADERHADDLLVLLQDIAGRVSANQWLPAATAFLGAYGRPEIIARLREKLVVPGGLGRVWWAVRTTYLASPELRRRIGALRESI